MTFVQQSNKAIFPPSPKTLSLSFHPAPVSRGRVPATVLPCNLFYTFQNLVTGYLTLLGGFPLLSDKESGPWPCPFGPCVLLQFCLAWCPSPAPAPALPAPGTRLSVLPPSLPCPSPRLGDGSSQPSQHRPLQPILTQWCFLREASPDLRTRVAPSLRSTVTAPIVSFPAFLVLASVPSCL